MYNIRVIIMNDTRIKIYRKIDYLISSFLRLNDIPQKTEYLSERMLTSTYGVFETKNDIHIIENSDIMNDYIFLKDIQCVIESEGHLKLEELKKLDILYGKYDEE